MDFVEEGEFGAVAAVFQGQEGDSREGDDGGGRCRLLGEAQRSLNIRDAWAGLVIRTSGRTPALPKSRMPWGKPPTAHGADAIAQQLNYAYAVLLASEFQGFCRDLHSEATDHLVSGASPLAIRVVLWNRMTEGRQLDRGNANPGTLAHDFGRFEMGLWDALRSNDPGMGQRQRQLADLNSWRNAVAHHDFTRLVRTNLRLSEVSAFRTACKALARNLDRVVGVRLRLLSAVPGSEFELPAEMVMP